MMATKDRLRIGVIGMRGIPSHYSGIERAAEGLYPRLAEIGHDITVYCRPRNPEYAGDEYRGVRLVSMPSIPLRSVDTLSHAAVSLTHALLRGRFDVIHLHALAPGLFSLVRRISRVPVVATIHGLDWQRAKWKGAGSAVLKLAEKVVVANADQIIVVSRDLQAYFQRTYGREVTYIPNGIEGRPEDSEANAACVGRLGLVPRQYIAYIGRLVPEKRIEDLVLAYRTVNTTHKLAIVGEGGHTDPYVRRLRECAGSDARVLFTGMLRGTVLDAVFRHAAALVFPSAMEGLPMGLLECMNYGIPAIASDIPPHRELLGALTDYDLFFNPGDVGGLSRQMNRILAAPETYDQVSVQARDHVRAFYSWPQIAAQTEAVLMKAVGRRQPGILSLDAT